MNTLSVQQSGPARELQRRLEKRRRDHDPELLRKFSETITEKLKKSAENGNRCFGTVPATEISKRSRMQGIADMPPNNMLIARVDAETLDPEYATGTLTAREKERYPLFYIKLPEQKGWDRVRGLEGFFRQGSGGTLLFLARINKATYMELPCYSYVEEMTPVIPELLCAGGYFIRLSGECRFGMLLVKGLHAVQDDPDKVSSMKVPLKMEDAFLQALLATAEHRFAVTDKYIEDPVNKAACSIEELYYLYKIDHASYPPELQGWIEKNFRALFGHASNLHKDTKHHLQSVLTYILVINWKRFLFDIPDLGEIKKRLDEQFYGLPRVKEQLLEVAAHIKHTYALPKWGILIHGPAGVGKTSIANAVADILGMPMGHLEFSIIRDSEALTGSSQIYSNGMPGLIIKQLYEQRSASLVMVLNEIDKAAGVMNRGNPLDALLPLLDGMGYTDTYIEAAIPTDGIFFIATCNELDAISQPILDRFYRIDVPAYSQAEKAAIFDGYIFPRVLASANVDPDEIRLTPKAREILLREYAVEPGARDLERFAEKIVNHYILCTEDNSQPDAEKLGYNEQEDFEYLVYDEDMLRRLLGPARVVRENIVLAPGTVFSGYIVDGTVHDFALQALIRPGEGTLKLINIDSTYQSGFCQMAYEYMRTLLPGKLQGKDVILSANQTLHDIPKNYIGYAVCAVILSALAQTVYPGKSLFWGGCDLLGTLYTDDTEIDPLLRMMEGKYDTVYAALGTASLIADSAVQGKTHIIEFPHMRVFCDFISQDRGFEAIDL